MVFLPRVGVLLIFIPLALSLDPSQQLIPRDELPLLKLVPPSIDFLEGAASEFGEFASDAVAKLGAFGLTDGVDIPPLGSSIDGLGNSVLYFVPDLPPAPSLPTLPQPPNSLPDSSPSTPPPPESQDDPGNPETPNPATLPSLNTGCDQLPIGAPDDCDPRTSYIVYASSCADGIGNDALTVTFTTQYRLNPDKIGRDDDCGIIFWVMRLSEDEAAEVRATPRVSDMALDGPMVSAGVPRPHGSRSKSVLGLEKRADEVVRQPSWNDLAFISTPPGAAVAGECLSFASGGDGVEVYVMEEGVTAISPEFDGKIRSFLYSTDARKTRTDDSIKGHGTCVASKTAGRTYGVAKGASLKICKLSPYINSLLKGLLMITNDLRRRFFTGKRVAGYTVIVIVWGWISGGGPNEKELVRSLRVLIKSFKAIVVVAAGNDFSADVDNPPTVTSTTWPAAAYSETLPIIVVGAVNQAGIREPYSRYGEAVVIHAPGTVRCTNQAGVGETEMIGTSFAAAEVAGLVAYLLPIVPSLRKSGDIPGEVLKYIKDEASYARTGSRVRSIWNRLYPDQGPPLYGWVP